ncbi:MAG: hypothetical protein VSS75_032500 [Candidatus Parabeggiatoa sp.]|nr:hypothetical protein [Candidatus Parabeggiatoa sp.]
MSKKPIKERYDNTGTPTGEHYTVNKDGDMNKWGKDKIKREGPAPKFSVPKKDKTHT